MAGVLAHGPKRGWIKKRGFKKRKALAVTNKTAASSQKVAALLVQCKKEGEGVASHTSHTKKGYEGGREGKEGINNKTLTPWVRL